MGDVFQSSRPISGDYRLAQADSEYNVVRVKPAKYGTEDVSVVDGAVEQLGWNDTYLIVAVVRGGWRIINMRSSEISGVLSEDEVRAERVRNPRVASIEVRPSGEVWRTLPRWQ
jgi:hypothetical protein